MDLVKDHIISCFGMALVVLGIVAASRRRAEDEREEMGFRLIIFILIFIATMIVLMDVWKVQWTINRAYAYWQEFEGIGIQSHAKVTPEFIMRWKAPQASIPQAIGGFIFGVIFFVYWVIFSGILYFLGHAHGSDIVLLVLISLTVSWALMTPVNWVFWFLMGMIFRPSIEIEARGWRWKRGMPPQLNYRALAAKMYGAGEGVPSAISSMVKKKKIKGLTGRLKAELEFMEMAGRHILKRESFED